MEYKLNTSNDRTFRLKARLILHGHRDQEKDDLRNDLASADMLLTRLVLSIGIVLRLYFPVTGIKGAFMQSGPITGELYVRPPKGLGTDSRTVWKLTNLPCGVVEAGRQGQKVSNDWLTRYIGMNMVHGC